MGAKELVKQVLTEKENKAYRRRLQKLKVTYGDWVTALEAEQTTAERRSASSREFVVICGSKGCLSTNAVKNIGSYFNAHPEVKLLYGDEDVWPGHAQGNEKTGDRRSPWYKPDWSPDLLDSSLYFGSLIALDRELFDKMKELYTASRPDGQMTAFRKGENPGVDYEVADLAAYEHWIHNCVALAGAYIKGRATVAHIPHVLFHCESEKEQVKFLEDTQFLQNGRNEYMRDFRDGWVNSENTDKDTGCPERTPVVSVVIPSKDQPEILEKCLRGCMTAACVGQENNLPLEIILVDNGSDGENRNRVEGLVMKLSAPEFRIDYLYRPMEFHFSKMCNLGAEKAKGRFFLFLNDDVELCLPGCIEKMAALADRFYTGAVGMKLLYPNSSRIQHAGITNLPMGPVHKLQFLDDNECYYYNSNRGWKNVPAVTGACLMVEKEKFQEAGCFSEELRVAFNDVDLGFTLLELGYWNVCVNDLYAYHHESLSRGADETAEKLERLLEERRRLYHRHPALEGMDPFYSMYLNREGLDTRIRPAWVTAGNCLQEVKDTPERFTDLGCRQDECLLVRIEECGCEGIRGYSVVLGDNNACYEKRLLLKKLKDTSCDGEFQDTASDEIYVIKLADQYRPDLEENMPDQVNVGLSGFAVKVGRKILPPGTYRLGTTAKNRVTGLKLINWSNRTYHVEQ